MWASSAEQTGIASDGAGMVLEDDAVAAVTAAAVAVWFEHAMETT